MLARLVQRQVLTDAIATFWFEPEHPIPFLAGQYIELFLPHESVDERGANRWFTISSSPREPLIGLTMRLEQSPSSFKRHLQNLGIGAEVSFGEVLGDFVVPKSKKVPLVFVAGGVGITPFASMLQDLAERNEQRDIELFYAVRTKHEILFQDVFEAYGLTPHIIVRRHLTVQDIMPAVNAPARLYYLAGSQPMALNLQAQLQAAGIAASHIALDYFPGYLET